jgi:hypothetical protein
MLFIGCCILHKHFETSVFLLTEKCSIYDISNLLLDIISFGKVCVYAESWDQYKRKDGSLTSPIHRIVRIRLTQRFYALRGYSR